MIDGKNSFDQPVKNYLRTYDNMNLMLTWPDKCVLFNGTKATTFAIIDTKLYVPVLTLSTQDNAKLLQQLKSGIKRIIDWNKYEPKVSGQVPKPFLDFLINPSFQGINRLYFIVWK